MIAYNGLLGVTDHSYRQQSQATYLNFTTFKGLFAMYHSHFGWTLPMMMLGLAVGLAAVPAATAAEPLSKGDMAPDFKLAVVGEDRYVTLQELTRSGPIALVFLRGYPGYQCPLCTQQVGTLRNRAKALTEVTKHVVLVYPGPANELEKHSEQFLGSNALPEPLLMVRDPEMETVNQYGLRWIAPNETTYPATFVLDKHGRVVWSKISDSHAGRTNAQEIIEQLKKLR